MGALCGQRKDVRQTTARLRPDPAALDSSCSARPARTVVGVGGHAGDLAHFRFAIG